MKQPTIKDFCANQDSFAGSCTVILLAAAGIKKKGLHWLRHTFATLALQNGVDVKTVSSILGHFSAGFTLDTYAHVTTTAQREAAKKMDGVLGQRVP